MRQLERVLRFFRADWPLVAAAGALMLGAAMAGALKPWPLALIVDSVLGNKPPPDWLAGILAKAGKPAVLAVLAAAVLVVHSGQGVLSALQNYLLIKAGLRGLARVREAVFQRLLQLSLRFHQDARQGDIIYRATWDTYAFQTLFHHGLFTLVTASLSLALMFVIMARISATLAFVALGTVPFLVLAMRSFGATMRTRSASAHEADGRVASLIQQGMAALPLTLACTREETENRRFGAHAAAARDRRLSQHGWEILYLAAMAAIFGLGTGALVWVGAREVLNGWISVGEMLVFIAYLAQFYEPLNQLSHIGVTLSDASASVQRVFEVLDTPEEVRNMPGAVAVLGRDSDDRVRQAAEAPPPRALIARGALALERVSFGYETARPVLREISFALEPGRSAAVVGPSGAGKSTLLQLLPRFYDPCEGAVKLDGVDLRQLELHGLRSQIAFLMQEPILLPCTVAENIAYARPDATMAEIEEAARAAHADTFIARLPKGYDTPVGESATRLSAGEKQRLSLARAVLKDAPILLLDEPTASLDAESEALVWASLARLVRGRTVLLATHKLDAVRGLDQVLVLDQGRLIEEGSPAQLLSNSRSYLARLSR